MLGELFRFSLFIPPSVTLGSTLHKIDQLGSNLETLGEVREIYQSTGHIKRIS